MKIRLLLLCIFFGWGRGNSWVTLLSIKGPASSHLVAHLSHGALYLQVANVHREQHGSFTEVRPYLMSTHTPLTRDPH